MGLIDKQIQMSVPNASNCLTSSAVQASHIKRDKNVVYTIEDVYGMIIPLGLGLVGGLTILIFELLSVRLLKNNHKMGNLSFGTTATLPKAPPMAQV